MFSLADKLIPFFVFIVSYSFGSYLFLREPNLVINRLFIVIMLTPFIDDLVQLVYWLNISNNEYFSSFQDISLWLLPPLYYHFIESFEERSISWKKFFALYSTCIVSWFAYFTTASRYILFAYLALSFAWVVAKYVRTYGQIRRMHRYYQKIQYFLIYTGFTLNLALIIVLDFVLETNVLQAQMLSPLIVVSFIATALLKVRFANIFYILKKSTVYAIFLFAFIFSYIAAAVYLFNFFQIINNIYATYYMALFFVVFAIIFRPIVDFIRNFIDQHLFRIAFNYKIIVENFSQRVSSLVDYGETVSTVASLFNEAFKPNAVYFFDIADGANSLSILHGERPPATPSTLVDVGSRVRDIYGHGLDLTNIDPVFIDYMTPGKIPEDAFEFFSKMNIAILVPLFMQNTVTGYFMLGSKFMKDSYNDDDIQLISTIINQARAALNNAQIHKHLVESNRRLGETVTMLENTQLELAKKEKLAALGRLSANIAHEVKNPLGIMKISASSLSDALADRPKLREMANFINKEIDKLNHVVSELLDFARDREMKPVMSDIGALVSEVAERGRLYAKSENKTVDIKVEGIEKLSAMADPEQLSRALFNIVINAVDSIAKGRDGAIVIELSLADGGAVRIATADNGCGIEEARVKKGIEPFFTTKKNGTGLGLVVTQQIVARHGGRLAIASKLGEGTSVEVEFPAGIVEQA